MKPYGNKILLLVGGAMGSGKTSFAQFLRDLLGSAGGVTVDSFTTDDFWYERGNGTYDFEPSLIGEAHSWNESRVEDCMLKSPVDHNESEYHIIIVHNTFAAKWEADKYLPYAEAHGFSVINPIMRQLHDGSSIHVKDPQIIEQCLSKIACSFYNHKDEVTFFKRELELIQEGS
jgi:hypothetical protein